MALFVVFGVALMSVSMAAADNGPRALPLSGTALDSADATRRAVSAAAEDGFDTLLVPIPLDDIGEARAQAIDVLIHEARARGLRVHAVVQAIAATNRDELPISRGHIVYRHPEWLMVPRELAIELLEMDPRNPEYLGRLARWTRANGPAAAIHLSPLHSEAVDYIAEAVAQIATRFPVDGIHLAGMQYPGRNFDYSRRTLELFRTSVRRTVAEPEAIRLDAIQSIDPFAYTEERAEDWRRFRITRMTALVTRLRTTVRAIRPEMMVTASVVAGAERALDEHMQDWRTWLDNRFVDALADGDAASSTLLFSYEALLHPPATPTSAPPAADGTQ